MATLINIGNNIKVAIQNISYIEGKEIVLNNRHRFTVSDEVIEQVNTFLRNRNTGVFHYKGTVDTLADLPDTATDGDFYKVESESKYYAWNGTEWDDQITIVNLDGEVTARQQADATLRNDLEAQISQKTSAQIAADFEAVKAKLNAVADLTNTGFWVFAVTDADGNVTFGQTINGEIINALAL